MLRGCARPRVSSHSYHCLSYVLTGDSACEMCADGDENEKWFSRGSARPRVSLCSLHCLYHLLKGDGDGRRYLLSRGTARPLLNSNFPRFLWHYPWNCLHGLISALVSTRKYFLKRLAWYLCKGGCTNQHIGVRLPQVVAGSPTVTCQVIDQVRRRGGPPPVCFWVCYSWT